MRLASLGKVLGIVLLLVAGLAIAKEVAYPSATLRYKVTVEIETPEGLKTGSAVREVFIQRQPELPESGPDIRPKGEAVVIDLGKRGVVFALTSFDDYRTIFQAFPGPPGLTPEGLKYYSQLKNVKAALKPEEYPEYIRLVRFKNIDDPRAIEAVNPLHLEKYFGAGVTIKEVAIEMTNESVTSGDIDKYLSGIFWDKFQEWWRNISPEEKMEKANLFEFKTGVKK